MKSICKCVTLLGLTISLAACGDYPYYPPVTVTNNNPPPAAGSMHYGPPIKSYPDVTVTNGGSAANSMHYGN